MLEATDHPDHVELVVRDDGDGVAPEVRGSLFEPGCPTAAAAPASASASPAASRARFGGEVVLGPDPGGAVFVVHLPRR